MNDPEQGKTEAEQTSPPAPEGQARRRGGIIWAVLIVVVVAVVGAVLGWRSQRPLYHSEGIVYISPTLPSPHDPTGREVLPHFEGFVAYHVELLRSRRTTLMAMETDTWRAVGARHGPEAIACFEARRCVVHKPGTQHITVRFVDPRPNVAAAGTRAITEAYRSLWAELGGGSDLERLDYARSQVEDLTARSQSKADQILELTADDGGVEGLKIRHRAAIEQLLQVEKDFRKIQTAIRRIEDPSTAHDAAWPLTPGAIGAENEEMAGQLLELRLLEVKEEELRKTVGDENAELTALRQEIAVRRKLIEEFARHWNEIRAAKNAGAANLEELKDQERALAERLIMLKVQGQKMGQIRAKVERLLADKGNLGQRQEQMKGLASQLQAQLVGTGRVKIVESGTRPVAPFQDRRRFYAIAGGGIGALAGLVIVILIGMLRGRPATSAASATSSGSADS